MKTDHKKLSRKDFCVFTQIQTRWSDNDVYGHVNNVVYYSFFDTAVNKYLIEQGKLDIQNSDVIAYVVDSECQYHAPVAYPADIEVGHCVIALGRSSVTYRLAIFVDGQQEALATGRFVHVFVNRNTQTAEAIPSDIRQTLASIQRSDPLA